MQQNIPNFLERLLKEQYGQDLTAKILEGYLSKRKTTLRVNTLKSNNEEVENELKMNNIKFSNVTWYKQGIIIENAREDEIRKLKIYEEGKIYLQSLSSMIPAIVVNPKNDENILDMAAAPGGKTTQMAAISNNGAMITACEKNKIRADRLKYNLDKQGARRVNVIQQDSRKLDDFLKFDKVLLDAPCSGSGTANIFEEKFTEELINRSTKIQEELLKKAINLTKKGGEIIYSTCSILARENENILEKIIDKVEIQEIEKLEQIPTLSTKIKGTICVAPNENYEGFFIAKLIKK